jgi:hypothetical protein
MPYGTINVDTVTTSTTGGILGAGNASIMKNRLINSDMRIDQRNAGASVTPTAGQYTLDRWAANLSQASKFTVQQNASSITPPVGFTNYLGVTSSSSYSVVAGDYFSVYQQIEGFNTSDLGWGTANAKTITLSFQVYSSLTGTFGGVLQNSASSRSYPFTYSISAANTWTSISVTVAGDTAGTWIGATNGIGISIKFGLGAGSTYSGTAGSWSANNYQSATGATSVVGTNGATFYLTGVQLEVGSSATGFEYVNYQTSLANCQRYYSVINDVYVRGYLASAQAQTITLPVTMRTSPTVTKIGTWAVSNANQPSVSINNVTQQNCSSFGIAITPISANADGYTYTANATQYITASAEL